MSREVLCQEILDQIERRSATDFESSLLSGEIGIDKLASLKFLFNPICRRLSVEPFELTPEQLNRLARSEWIEFGTEWLTYSGPILGTNNLIHADSESDDPLPRNLEVDDEFIDFIKSAAIVIMDEETELFEAVVGAIRLMAIVYQANAYNKSFDKQMGFDSKEYSSAK